MLDKSQKFAVTGGTPLKGQIKVSGSKNAALPILCAALLSQKTSIIHNVPDIADIHTLLEIFNHLNVKTSFENNTVTIDASGLSDKQIPDDLICSMRASILLLGPLLARFGRVNISFPGGCVLGKRPVFAHTYALGKLGAKVINETEKLQLNITSNRKVNIGNAGQEISHEIIMPEISVTATENSVMLASITPGITVIRLAACEPHVQDLCHFLNKMGAKINGIGTYFLQIEGVKALHGTEYNITGDYLEAGTMIIAGLVTGGNIELTGVQTNQLDSFWQKLDEAGANYKIITGNDKPKNALGISNNSDIVIIKPSPKLQAITTLRTAVYPSFATDLQAPFSVLLTQANGQSKIFETLFEGRLNYLLELEKMGAKVQVLNPHQAIITGPTPLKAVPTASLDLRAGAAMVLAALCAEGTTEISNIHYIDRGYENFDGKLRALGAKIHRL